VDDRRFAERRAAALAERGAGDRLIRHDLAAAGVEQDVVEHVVAGLMDEEGRALRIVERRGVSPKTSRYLASKGFSHEVVHAVVARTGDEGLG
jgi:SOS response regulatory protein OraA/RecX